LRPACGGAPCALLTDDLGCAFLFGPAWRRRHRRSAEER